MFMLLYYDLLGVLKLGSVAYGNYSYGIKGCQRCDRVVRRSSKGFQRGVI